MQLIQEDCREYGTVLHSGGSYISDTAASEPVTSQDAEYPITYVVRESVFMFHDNVDLGAGRYQMCWKHDNATSGVAVGTFTVEGMSNQTQVT